jgi:hypothetical protein
MLLSWPCGPIVTSRVRRDTGHPARHWASGVTLEVTAYIVGVPFRARDAGAEMLTLVCRVTCSRVQRRRVVQAERETGAAMRFEATVYRTARSAELGAVDALDLDRVPDPEGGVRVLVGPEDMRRLVAEGFEVRVQAVAPVAPLDPGDRKSVV